MLATKEERLAAAQSYLDEHAYFTVEDYQRITGLLHTSAVRELHGFASNPETGIRKSGRGSHKVYTSAGKTV